MLCLLALACASIAFRSSKVKRTGTIFPLASPLGSLGRPTFLGFFCISELLNDCRSDCCLCRCDGVDMKNRYMSSWFLWVVGIMRPGIRFACLWMAVQLKYLHDAIPNRLSLKRFFHWYAFNMLCFDSMQTADYVA